MAPTYIEGYLATITVGGVTYSTYASRAGLSLTQEPLQNTHLTDRNHTFLPGLQGGSLAVDLHMATEFANAINTAYDDRATLAFSFRPGALGTKDAGQRDGFAVIEDFTQEGTGDGEWDITLSLQVTGPAAYTAPV